MRTRLRSLMYCTFSSASKGVDIGTPSDMISIAWSVFSDFKVKRALNRSCRGTEPDLLSSDALSAEYESSETSSIMRV